MAQENVTDESIAELVERTAEATKAYMRGEMDTYFRLIRHDEDFLLMSPFGGEPQRGIDTSPESLEGRRRYFQNGDAELDVLQTYASGDMVVVAAIERQHGEVGGLADQDWSLRVTLVFRRDGANWQLVHRHADPLVNEITIEQAFSVARG